MFCLIGTNAADYGMVSKVVGPKSDGVVQIDNAYVLGASRAFVHRSHSGSYGEVNSEEGYQNLRRFFFGTRKATATLVNAQLPPSTDADVVDVWQAEVRLSVRGLPVLMTERTAAHYCPIELGKVVGAAAGTAPGPDDDVVTGGHWRPPGRACRSRWPWFSCSTRCGRSGCSARTWSLARSRPAAATSCT